MKNENFHQIRQQFSNLIKENSGFFTDCLYFSSNSSIFCKIFAKFRQFFIKIRPKKFHFSFGEWNFIFHSPKFCADFLVKFWDWSGAKVWESCRAWKMLQNVYLDATIGFETEENEPPKVWRQIFLFFIRLLTSYRFHLSQAPLSEFRKTGLKSVGPYPPSPAPVNVGRNERRARCASSSSSSIKSPSSRACRLIRILNVFNVFL